MKLKQSAILVCLFLGFGWFSQTQVEASVVADQVVFSDDFSQGLDKWQQTRGDINIWSIVNGKLQAFISTGSTMTELIPTDEFWRQDWKNLEYSLEFTPLAGIDRNISFGFQDIANWYDLHFVEYFMELTRRVHDNIIFSEHFDFSMKNGHTYHLIVQFIDGQIIAWIDGVKLVDINDWTFSQNFGKIALRATTGAAYPTHVLFDNVVVKLLGENNISLAVPLVKQTDALWQDVEYDSADNWSETPTIRRWGCALTSAVMVLRYHGITHLPDGSDITPQSLNAWLKTQVDGYLGQGLVNWLAISRLTRLVSQQLQTPKLEFSRYVGDQLTVAIAEIEQLKPVILEIAGHFLVADGVTTDKTDVLIKDPAYNYDLFSQHQTSLRSTLTFQPSQTDLSYILLVYEPTLDVSLTAKSGTPLSLTTLDEQLSDHVDQSGEKTVTNRYQQLAKPVAGEYRILVKQARLKPYQLQVLAYDTEGNPSVLDTKGWVGTEPVELTLKYRSDGKSQLISTNSFSRLRKHLRLTQRQLGWRWRIFYLLMDQCLSRAIKYPRQRQSYLNQLRSHLRIGRPFMTKNTHLYLESQVRALENSR